MQQLSQTESCQVNENFIMNHTRVKHVYQFFFLLFKCSNLQCHEQRKLFLESEMLERNVVGMLINLLQTIALFYIPSQSVSQFPAPV